MQYPYFEPCNAKSQKCPWGVRYVRFPHLNDPTERLQFQKRRFAKKRLRCLMATIPRPRGGTNQPAQKRKFLGRCCL